jgi:hypothetical protein
LGEPDTFCFLLPSIHLSFYSPRFIPATGSLRSSPRPYSPKRFQIILEEEYANLPDPKTVESEEPLSKFLKVPHLAVELAPGESLYIPPYWLVRVESIQLSLFLDVSSLSKEQALLSEAQSLGVLLGKVSTPEEKIVAAQVYAVHFLSRVRGLKSPDKFARSHFDSRYSRLYPSDSLFMAKLKRTFHCLADNVTLHESILQKCPSSCLLFVDIV